MVSPALKAEIKTPVKSEEAGILFNPEQKVETQNEVKRGGNGILLKPKQEIVAKSAAQIVNEQHGK